MVGGSSMAEDEKKKEVAEPPPGCKPMMIGMKNMKKYELKTGEGIRDVLPFKIFQKEAVLEEIVKLGFYSDFNDFKKDIEVRGTPLARDMRCSGRNRQPFSCGLRPFEQARSSLCISPFPFQALSRSMPFIPVQSFAANVVSGRLPASTGFSMHLLSSRPVPLHHPCIFPCHL